ncbi:hypothetical protein PIB30_020038 [Stylosanthes scabra]|uniref:Uncharacterized protein n=1 Tax=Stylosanthes scabra TaxID=79078 RepID=A0ABU6S8L8_9FABA|nr:hypothetical protein [Stylosanthes scabra]
MEAQGVPVTIANLAIHKHREEEMNRERMRHNQTVQEAASQRAREANKGKAREVVLDSEEEESEEMYSSPSEEWDSIDWSFIPRGNDIHFTVVLLERFGALADFYAIVQGKRLGAHVIRELSTSNVKPKRLKKHLKAATPRYMWKEDVIRGEQRHAMSSFDESQSNRSH